MHHGDSSKNAYLKYTTIYNERIRKDETILSLDKEPVIDKEFYLRISIETTIEIVKNLFHKLKNFLRNNARKYPSVRIQFDASSYTDNKDSDDLHIKMIIDTITEALKYSVNTEFRKSIYELYRVDSSNEALNEIYNRICNCIPDK